MIPLIGARSPNLPTSLLKGFGDKVTKTPTLTTVMKIADGDVDMTDAPCNNNDTVCPENRVQEEYVESISDESSFYGIIS